MAPPKLNRKCSIDGCSKRHLANGYCAMHLRRVRLYGDPHFVKALQIHGATILERWYHYTDRVGVGCWEWQGSRDSNGYGRLNVDGVPMLAHRVAWVLFRGAITSGEHVCHRCDNPPCVRPEHLFLGDYQANTDDKMAKKRHRFGTSRGSDHGCSKLVESDVREIRSSEEPLRHLAARYGVSMATISDIRNWKSWRHLP